MIGSFADSKGNVLIVGIVNFAIAVIFVERSVFGLNPTELSKSLR